MEPGEYDLIAGVELRHWWYLGMRSVAETMLDDCIGASAANEGRPPLQILDAGCGTGGALDWLARFGSVTGLDFHPRAIHHAARHSRRLCQASVLAIPFRRDSFDLVTSQEVLYHRAVTDDAAALREFARVLRLGGWLLLRVPAYDWLRGAHDAQVHTRHRYARRELIDLLAGGGFAVRRMTSAGACVLVPAIARRLLESRNAAPYSDVSLPAPALNALLTRLLRAEARWLRRHDLAFGLQLVALARKQT